MKRRDTGQYRVLRCRLLRTDHEIQRFVEIVAEAKYNGNQSRALRDLLRYALRKWQEDRLPLGAKPFRKA